MRRLLNAILLIFLLLLHSGPVAAQSSRLTGLLPLAACRAQGWAKRT